MLTASETFKLFLYSTKISSLFSCISIAFKSVATRSTMLFTCSFSFFSDTDNVIFSPNLSNEMKSIFFAVTNSSKYSFTEFSFSSFKPSSITSILAFNCELAFVYNPTQSLYLSCTTCIGAITASSAFL